MKKQGVLSLKLNGNETYELRRLVGRELNLTKPTTRENRMRIAYLTRLQFKLHGSYQCSHCKQWVIKGEKHVLEQKSS